VSRFLLSCGGTGGHLSPGVALAEGLVARGHEVVLVISQKKVDARLIEKYPQLTFRAMPGSGLAWHPVRFVRFVSSQIAALRFCRRLIQTFQPDAIVGFGGFTCAPAAVAGRLARIPVTLHESNRVPGLAIRLLGRLAARVYLPIGIRLSGVSAAATRHVGLPVRREMVRWPVGAAREAMGLYPNQKVLTVLGGSQGASPLNAWVRERLPSLAAAGVQVYCVTGLGKGAPETLDLRISGAEPVRAIFTPFCDRMAELLSASDLVVSRAGAGTLAELIRCETPAILVPYPQAASDHQRANARFFERQGGGLVIEQAALAGLEAEVLDALFNDWLLRKFRGNLRRMDRANALESMVQDLETLARPRGGTPAPEPAPAVASA
jgi:UDP-N-acetylglucosamine--N-acetylmuramyl-(pentapeptide) pyrophosphoryl-undecaprenol N-acetylglucosamine transferase